MNQFLKKLPNIILYSFALVGIALFWTNLAEAALFDHLWWKEFRVIGSLFLYGIILFTGFWIIEKYHIINYVVEVFFEFLLFAVLYLVFGYLFKWYQFEYWWAMPIQSFPVFVILYFLRFRTIQKELKQIDKLLNRMNSEVHKNLD